MQGCNDTVVDDYVPANGLCHCCMDAIARSVLQQDEETTNDNESTEFLSAQEEEERKEGLCKDNCVM